MFMEYEDAAERIRYQLQEELRKLSFYVEIPFDARKIISSNQFLYGDQFGDTPRIGKQVLVYKTDATLLGRTTSEVKIANTVGIIIGDLYGRVLIYMPENELFIGWLEEDEFKILNIMDTVKNTLN